MTGFDEGSPAPDGVSMQYRHRIRWTATAHLPRAPNDIAALLPFRTAISPPVFELLNADRPQLIPWMA
jgi:hypothetical protein